MYKIVRKQELNASVTLMEIEAPFVARKAKAGQFIIFRIDEMGERVPLTIAGYDREKGTVTIIFQKVGFSTNALGALEEGDYIHDFVGPLGKPTPVEGKKKVCVVGGGVGCAIALPSAKAFKEAGADVTVIVGFRSKDIVILEDEFKAVADRLILMTDDGTYGRHGLVTQPLQEMLEAGETFDEVLAIGPVPMMKFVCKTTQPFGVHTMVSLNPIMVDGTGMPRHGRRRDQVRLRGRPRVRRPSGGFRRADQPQRHLPRPGGRGQGEPRLPHRVHGQGPDQIRR